MGNIATRGLPRPREAQEHINFLKLSAACLTIKYFLHDLDGKHVKNLVVNTCAVSILNDMGTCHSNKCNECEKNSMCLTAAHIPGDQNITADFESSHFNVEIE